MAATKRRKKKSCVYSTRLCIFAAISLERMFEPEFIISNVGDTVSVIIAKIINMAETKNARARIVYEPQIEFRETALELTDQNSRILCRAINDGFDWSKSPQGFAYWSVFCDWLRQEGRNIRTLKDLEMEFEE